MDNVDLVDVKIIILIILKDSLFIIPQEDV